MKLRICIFLILLLQLSSVSAQSDQSLKKVMPALSNTGVRTLNVRLESSSTCLFGDLDLILLDIRHGQGKINLRLTLEPLPLGSGKTYFGIRNKNVDKERKSSLSSYKVEIPASEKSNAFLVMLCSANEEDQKNPCSSKNLVKPSDATLPYRADSRDLSNSNLSLIKPRAVGAMPDTKIYYSNLLITEENHFKITDQVLTSESLEKILTSVGADFQTTKAIFTDYVKYNSVLQSFPIEIAKGDPVVALPFFDADRCIQPRAKKPKNGLATSGRPMLPGSTIE